MEANDLVEKKPDRLLDKIPDAIMSFIERTGRKGVPPRLIVADLV
jgi:hypothetical protein